MTAPGALSPVVDARVFGSARGEVFANWDPVAFCWRDGEPAPGEPTVARNRAPEFCGGWMPYGLTRAGTALALVTSGHEPVGRRRLTWPTPKVTTNRTSRHSITRDGHWSAPGLEQAAELSEGILPREVRSLGEIKSPAARALWPAGPSSRGWSMPRASSGIRSRLRDPDNIRAAESRSEVQVALAEERAGSWLNPAWVEWLMGFPTGWTFGPSQASEEGAR
jgi:hypothetical protein